ncbi:hypothetical protein ACOSP7_032589 [Xanthoceras sorbifolium]
MVFPSVPLYLDPPNWQQQQNQQPGGISTESASQQLPPQPPSQLQSIGGGGGGGSIRAGSMTDRARLAKIPQPETALKCPRCDSTNTKFCYFNNYSLSQPRHFCKTCRRYWTRGGALRNVPVGGGCRRNKRSKANNSATSTTNARSKSPVVTENNNQLAATSTTTDSILFHAPPPPQLPILPPLHHFSDFNSGIGFGGIQGPEVAAAGGGGGSFYSSSGLVEQWSRSQQHPFLSGGLEPTTGLYSLESDGVELTGYVSQLRSSKPLLDNSGVVNDDQFASVKREDNNSNNNQGLNLSRNFLGISGNDHQYWGTSNNNAWTDHNLHGFTSSSTSHLLG